MLWDIHNLFWFPNPLSYHIVSYGCTSIIALRHRRCRRCCCRRASRAIIATNGPRPRGWRDRHQASASAKETDMEPSPSPGKVSGKRQRHHARRHRHQRTRSRCQAREGGGWGALNKYACTWPGVPCYCNKLAAMNRAANEQHSGGEQQGAGCSRDQNNAHIPTRRYT